jgi:glyoxylase-like metal-dependent hydrolase (beta-lactamase superfamily II)
VIVDAVPAAGFDLQGWVSPGADLTAMLEDGDLIDLGDRRFEVMHVPGHTPGSIALWEPATALLFTGDAIYVDARLSFEDRVAAAGSLSRMAALPVRMVHAGHERSFGGEELRAVVAAELSIEKE